MDSNSRTEDAQLMAEVAAESIGWLPLGECSYLHIGDPDALVIDVVGLPDSGMVGMNVLLIGY